IQLLLRSTTEQFRSSLENNLHEQHRTTCEKERAYIERVDATVVGGRVRKHIRGKREEDDTRKPDEVDPHDQRRVTADQVEDAMVHNPETCDHGEGDGEREERAPMLDEEPADASRLRDLG